MQRLPAARGIRTLLPSWHQGYASAPLRIPSTVLRSSARASLWRTSSVAAWKSSFSTARSLRDQRAPLTEPPSSAPAVSDEEAEPKKDVPSYDMTFTCKKCTTRSTHRVSKQGYHHGTVLVTCPGCKNRHLICDHLKIFSDSRITIEDILSDKGELLKRGVLKPDGDIELYK